MYTHNYYVSFIYLIYTPENYFSTPVFWTSYVSEHMVSLAPSVKYDGKINAIWKMRLWANENKEQLSQFGQYCN